MAILARYLRTRTLRILQQPDEAENGDELVPRKFEALLRADFRPFLEKVFSTLSPGQSFIPTWHLEAIAYQLERVRRGEISA